MKLLVKKTDNVEGLERGLQLLFAQLPDSCTSVENKCLCIDFLFLDYKATFTKL